MRRKRTEVISGVRIKGITCVMLQLKDITGQKVESGRDWESGRHNYEREVRNLKRQIEKC